MFDPKPSSRVTIDGRHCYSSQHIVREVNWQQRHIDSLLFAALPTHSLVRLAALGQLQLLQQAGFVVGIQIIPVHVL